MHALWNAIQHSFKPAPSPDQRSIRVNSQDLEKFAKCLEYHHRKVTPLWPAANGEVERFMRPVAKVLRTARIEQKYWKQELYASYEHTGAHHIQGHENLQTKCYYTDRFAPDFQNYSNFQQKQNKHQYIIINMMNTSKRKRSSIQTTRDVKLYFFHIRYSFCNNRLIIDDRCHLASTPVVHNRRCHKLCASCTETDSGPAATQWACRMAGDQRQRSSVTQSLALHCPGGGCVLAIGSCG